jgi:hypothetical protein
MSVARCVTVSCDGGGCQRTVVLAATEERPVVMVVVARDLAAGRDWTHKDGVDLCPVHSHMRV